ncbi:WapI family immunity protein [Wohlfahrtiimonas larvae]|uniref:Uncharacterized protein n=1 Tax=Wohlfahrtiimonas larvae TaxID=1157986 RepID=A0ABP9MJZ9_9GAMM|nr:hypothetical protein [Wohlfahrtiimonas larvae]
MYLRDDKTIFRMKILGYEFPLSKQYDDSNWLVLQIAVESDVGNLFFEAQDACLQAGELIMIRDWLQKLKSENINSALNFFEPELSFSYSSYPKSQLFVHLKYSLYPEEDSKNAESGAEKTLIFDLKDHKILEDNIHTLNKMIDKYPSRYSP